MQAIRVLRAQSRPASPSPAPYIPPSTNNTDSLAYQPATSHADDSVKERSGNPITRIQNLSLSSLAKRAIPTPPPTTTPSPVPSAIVQDGHYLNTLGMKLNEAATKVLSMPVVSGGGSSGADVWKGRRAIPFGRGRCFAVLIETELDASQGNPNLRHAILRLLPRSLHVLISNVSAQVSQLLPFPAFVPTNLNAPLHPTTVHGLALAQFCSEILETFTTYKLGTATSDLAVIRAHLETLITRITAPLFGQLQTEVHALLEPLSHSSGMTNSPAFGSSKKEEKSMKPHPAVVALSQTMPLIQKALRRYTFDTCAATQTSLATFHINTLWQTMVQLAHRTPVLPPLHHPESANGIGPKSSLHSFANALTPPGSPALKMRKITPPASPPTTLRKMTPPGSPPAKKRLALPGLPNSPLVNTIALGSESPPKQVVNLKKHASSGSLESRSSSPDKLSSTSSSTLLQSAQLQHHRASISSGTGAVASPWLISLAMDARALWDILANLDARPINESLPREAVDETYERFAAFRDWLTGAVHGKLSEGVPEEVPLLVVLPILLGEAWIDASSSSRNEGATTFVGMARLLGYADEETYKRTMACGFRRADECEPMFGSAVVNRLEREEEWVREVESFVRGRVGI